MRFLKIFFAASLFCIFTAGISAVNEFPSPVAFAAGPAFARNLTIGTRGEDVSILQQFLISKGHLKISKPTGYFGFLTRDALKFWQLSAGINPPAGFFGPISRARVDMDIQQPSADAVNAQIPVGLPSPAITAVNPVNIKSGEGLPIRLKIPNLNIDALFQYNDLASDGSIEIPSNIVDIGWFTGSSRPGEKGNSVVTGHVAQIRGGVLTKPGVFFNLNKIQAGDKIYILNDKGESITFSVREIRTFDSDADAADVFTSRDDSAHLILITCEGFWIPSQLSYTKRLVVFTDKE